MYTLKIAKGYLLGKSRINAINWIAIVSIVAIMVVSFGLITALSVFNGYVDIIKSVNSEVDPIILIRKQSQENFPVNSIDLSSLEKDKNIDIQPILISKGLLKVDSRHRMVMIEGIDSGYYRYLDKTLSTKYNIFDNPKNTNTSLPNTTYINVGIAIAMDPNISNYIRSDEVSLILPRRKGLINPLAPITSFSFSKVKINKVYPEVREDFDNSIFVPIDSLRNILTYNNKEVSAIMVLPKVKDVDTPLYINKIQKLLPKGFEVLDRNEQHPEVAAIIKTEKIITTLIMLFILLLAVFNVSGCILMMIIEKKDDTYMMRAIGMPLSKRKQVFRITGMLIASIGIALGTILGAIFCLLQSSYGFISSGGSGFSFSALPMDLQPIDIIVVIFSSLLISYLMILYSTRFINK